jgi:hypothetical protein
VEEDQVTATAACHITTRRNPTNLGSESAVSVSRSPSLRQYGVATAVPLHLLEQLPTSRDATQEPPESRRHHQLAFTAAGRRDSVSGIGNLHHCLLRRSCRPQDQRHESRLSEPLHVYERPGAPPASPEQPPDPTLRRNAGGVYGTIALRAH